MGLLGRTSDAGLNNAYMTNLQVCDADYNTYKEFLVAGKTFISSSTLALYNPLDRIGVLSDFIDMMSGYRSDPGVVTSYHTTYTNIGTLWGDFARYAASKGITYDFVGAWQQIIKAGLNQQVSSGRTQLTGYITTQLVYWQSTAPVTDGYSQTVIAASIQTLQNWAQNVNTLVQIPIAAMTA